LRIVLRTSGSIVTWRRAQIVLLSAPAMTPPAISEVVFSDADTVREVTRNFNRDGFDALYPRYRGGRPQTFVRGLSDLGQAFTQIASSHASFEVNNIPELVYLTDVVLGAASVPRTLVRQPRPLQARGHDQRLEPTRLHDLGG